MDAKPKESMYNAWTMNLCTDQVSWS